MQLLVYIIAYPLLWVISVLPWKLFYLFSDYVRFWVYNVFGYRKKMVRKNLQLSFPEKSKKELDIIEKKFYRHMCDVFLEMIRSMSMSQEEMAERFVYKNLEIFKKYEEEHQSVSLFCGHYASWEWMMSLGYYIKHKGYGIYMPIANKYFDRLVQRIRMKHKAYLIAAKDASKTIKKHFVDNELTMYGVAGDQSPMLHRATYWREFLGVKVPVVVGGEKRAKEYNHAVIFLDIQKVKRGYYETTFKLITDKPKEHPNYEITDTFVDLLEKQIRNKPEYYLWTHNRFKHMHKVPPEFQ